MSMTKPDASQITYLSAGIGAVPLSVETMLRHFVTVDGYGADPSLSAAANAIAFQKALDAYPSNVDVMIPPGSYSIAGGLNIRGSGKRLIGIGLPDLSFTGNDIVCIDIRPTALSSVEQGQSASGFQIWASACTGNSNIGVQVSGNSFWAKLVSLDIHYVGLGRTGGVGVKILGGYDVSLPGDGHSTPFFCGLDGIRVSDCYNGYEFGFGMGGAAALTTWTAHNVYCATPQGYGYYFKNCSSGTATGVHCESSVGYGVVLDNTSNNFIAGGMVEGSALANWHFINKTSQPDTVLANTYHDTSTAATWPNFPDTMQTAGAMVQKIVKAPLVAVENNETLDLADYGILSVLTRSGAWAKVLLGYATYPTGQFTEILEKGTTIDLWTNVAGTGGKINFYWNAGSSTWRIQNLTGIAQILTIQTFSEG